MVKAIVVENLTKNYKKVKIQVNLKIKKGEIFILFGPNGAGKTTLIKMLSTLTKPDEGSAKILGTGVTKEPNKVRKSMGVLLQETSLYEDLTVYHNLLFRARLYEVENKSKNIKELLNLLKLSEWKNKKVKNLSGGMKRKLALASVLISDPEILILDEPTTGLDPRARNKILRYLEKINRKGTTILMTTHYPEEGEIADRVGIMNKGSMIKVGKPNKIKKEISGSYLIRTDEPSKVKKTLENLIRDSKKLEEGLFIKTELNYPRIKGKLKNLDVESIEIIQKPRLDKVFLYYTGEEFK